MSKAEIEDLQKLDAVIRQHESDSFINYEELSDDDEVYEDVDPCVDISALKEYTPSSLLKDEEKQLIDSCQDPDLKLLLELNRSKNLKLMQLYTKIKDLLIECQTNIVVKSQQIGSCSDQFKRIINRFWRFGYPYFKSTDGYPCPRNEYVARKDANGELRFYDMVPTNKWNGKDINRLKKGVLFCFKAGRDMEAKRKITDLEKDIVMERCEDKLAELKGLVAELSETINSDDQELPTDSSDRFVDWERVSAVFLQGKYSSQECRSFWYLYQDPRINKSPWSVSEQKKLDKLVRKYKHQNWERIASDLGTSRSALIVCNHHFMGQALCGGKFTPEDDAILLDMVENHAEGDRIPWAKIAHFFKNHTRKQIFYRWRYYLNERGRTTKGAFTDAEDVLLMVLVDRFGKSFSKCEKYFPTRSMAQLKARYTTNLKVNWKKGPFTIEEDEKMMAYVAEHGTARWAALSSQINRSANQLRHRHRLIAQYLKDKPGAAIRDAPRKTDRSREDNYPFLRSLADRYRYADVPTLAEIRDAIRATNGDATSKMEDEDGDGQDEDVERMLIEFFGEDESKATDDAQATEASRAVHRVLTLLGARLDVPVGFAADPRLDATDVAVLRHLCASLPLVDGRRAFRVGGDDAFSTLMAPTASSSIGFRALADAFAINPDNVLAGVATPKQTTWCVHTNLGRLPGALKKSVVENRALFYRRFLWTFKLTAVTTLTPPPEPLVAEFKAFATHRVGQVRRTYTRKGRGGSEARAKRRKIEEAERDDEADRDAEDLMALEAALKREGDLVGL